MASKRGVTCPRGVGGPGGVARCGISGVTCASGVRQPGQVASLELYQGSRRWLDLASHVTGRGVRTWRRRTWRHNMASGAIDLRSVAGRGVNTWRLQASRQVSSKHSRRAICAPPQATPLSASGSRTLPPGFPAPHHLPSCCPCRAHGPQR